MIFNYTDIKMILLCTVIMIYVRTFWVTTTYMISTSGRTVDVFIFVTTKLTGMRSNLHVYLTCNFTRNWTVLHVN